METIKEKRKQERRLWRGWHWLKRRLGLEAAERRKGERRVEEKKA
jgi:hypothetical protein